MKINQKIHRTILITFLTLIQIHIYAQNFQIEEYGKSKSSTKIFTKTTSPGDSIYDIQIPYMDHKYSYKDYKCDKLIFRPTGIVEFENSCPGDYTLRGILGEYQYNTEDHIQIISDPLNDYSQVIDRIYSEPNSDSILKFLIVDMNSNIIAEALTISYIERPTFLKRPKSISIYRTNNSELVNKKIILTDISFHFYRNNERKLDYIPMNWKVKLEPKTYVIVLRNNGYDVKLENGNMNMYRWNYENQQMEQFGELKHSFN